MIGPLFRLAVVAAKIAPRVPWWQPILMSAGDTISAVGNRVVDRMLADKELTFDQKLSRLDAVLKDGRITVQEWQKGRDSLMSGYAGQQ